MQPSSDDYQIRVERSSDEKLGLSLDREDDATMLRITAVSEGLVEKWNSENPESVVKLDDRIIRVNGVHQDAAEMIAECKKSGVLEIFLRRGAVFEAAPATAPTTKEGSGGCETCDYDWHELTLTKEECEDIEVVMTVKMTSMMESLGISDPTELERRFPDFEPEFKMTDALGVELDGPDSLEIEDEDDGRFPLTFKMKFPKLAKSSADAGSKDAPLTVPVSNDANGISSGKQLQRKAELEACLLKGPSSLLRKGGVTLVFVQPQPQPTQIFQCSGPAGAANWGTRQVPGDFAIFEFSADGDGGDKPDMRWGVMACVLPILASDEDACPALPSSENVNNFCSGWVECVKQAQGIRDTPEVERNGWDEEIGRAHV